MKTRQHNAARRALAAHFYRKNHLAFALSLLAVLLTALLNLVLTWLMQQMIDTASGVSGAYSLRTLALLTLGVLGLVVLLKWLSWLSKPRFMQRAMQQYKDYAFAQLTRKSIAAFSRENTAQYLSAFSSDAASIETQYLEGLFELLSNLVLLAGSMVMMLLYDPLMSAIACGFFVLPLAASLLTGTRIQTAERTVSDRNSTFLATLKDALNGFPVIKSFRAEREIGTLFSRSDAAVEDAKCSKRKLLTILAMLGSVTAVTAQFGTFLVGIGLLLSGWDITAGILITFLDLTANVIGPIRELPKQLADRKAALALIDKLADALARNVHDAGESLSPQLTQGIALQNVSFGYTPETEVLHNISLQLEAGKSYAIVGASGSGKSTLLELLMAGHSNYSGEIRYDGHELRSIRTTSLYDLVSMIRQNVFVFNATIQENITMFRSFPADEIERAIAQSGLSALVAEKGADYLCGENGAGLSGGERQRVSIARSLLRQSQVLLVDEATAALDAATAHQVAGSILDLHGMTRVVVTHDLDESILRRYDCILALKAGRLVECGSFDTLMHRRGYFYSLVTIS